MLVSILTCYILSNTVLLYHVTHTAASRVQWKVHPHQYQVYVSPGERVHAGTYLVWGLNVSDIVQFIHVDYCTVVMTLHAVGGASES